MGPGRSIRKLIEQRVQSGCKASVRPATLMQWSSWYHWQDFVKEWDAAQLAEKQRRATEAIEKLNEAQAKMAQDAMLRISSRLNDLLEIDEYAVRRWKQHVSGEKPFAKEEDRPRLLVSPRTLVDYFRATADLARIATGAATEVIAQQVELSGKQGEAIETRQTFSLDVSRLTNPELQTLLVLLEQVEARTSG